MENFVQESLLKNDKIKLFFHLSGEEQ